MTIIDDYRYTPNEAARHCNVSKRTLLKAFRKGNLKGSRLNDRVIRFSKEQLDDWLKGKS